MVRILTRICISIQVISKKKGKNFDLKNTGRSYSLSRLDPAAIDDQIIHQNREDFVWIKHLDMISCANVKAVQSAAGRSSLWSRAATIKSEQLSYTINGIWITFDKHVLHGSDTEGHSCKQLVRYRPTGVCRILKHPTAAIGYGFT